MGAPWRTWSGVEDEKRRFDWRTVFAMLIMLVAQGAAEYGVMSTQINDLSRRVERLEQKIDERMEPRDEFEKRHEDLRREVENLRERIQQIEMRAK